MKVKLLFFGATADIVGKRELLIRCDEGNASKLIEQIVADHAGLAAHKLLFSINQQYTTGDEIVQDGDELAIFTAVSGG